MKEQIQKILDKWADGDITDKEFIGIIQRMVDWKSPDDWITLSGGTGPVNLKGKSNDPKERIDSEARRHSLRPCKKCGELPAFNGIVCWCWNEACSSRGNIIELSIWQSDEQPSSNAKMRVLTRVNYQNNIFILLEDEHGQYVYTQQNDDADDWAVFQEMPLENPKREEVIFTVNDYLTEA